MRKGKDFLKTRRNEADKEDSRILQQLNSTRMRRANVKRRSPYAGRGVRPGYISYGLAGRDVAVDETRQAIRSDSVMIGRFEISK